MNKSFKNTKNMINYTINIHKKYLSDNMETHNSTVTKMYRKVLFLLLKKILIQ